MNYFQFMPFLEGTPPILCDTKETERPMDGRRWQVVDSVAGWLRRSAPASPRARGDWGATWGREFLSGSADLLFPPNCLVCSAPILHAPDFPSGTLFCSGCLARFPRLEAPLCQRCASPIRGGGESQPQCARCSRRKYHFSGATAYGIYDRGLREAVIRAKKSREFPLAHALGKLLANHCGGLPSMQKLDVVVAMPTYWTRRWQRGGNSAEVLAAEVAAFLRIPLAPNVLQVRRPTRKQGMLSPSERFRNVLDAYRVRHNRQIEGADVLLVDDVLTTGATASEVARLLKRSGAKSVWVAVIARGVGRD